MWFDYGKEFKQKGSGMIEELSATLNLPSHSHTFTLTKAHPDDGSASIHSTQTTVIRTNCIDCLDRTNQIQYAISKAAILSALKGEGEGEGVLESKEAEESFRSLWVQNGNAISRQYSGTETMRNKLIRPDDSVVGDLMVGLRRYSLGHFYDFYYQVRVDRLRTAWTCTSEGWI